MNMTVVPHSRGTITYSYAEPMVIELDGEVIVRDEKFSVTTSRHVNKFVAGRESRLVETPEFFDILRSLVL